MVKDFKDLFANYNCDIVMESSLKWRARELATQAGLGGSPFLVVCDKATRMAADHIIEDLESDVLELEGKPQADIKTVELIRSYKAQALIAVGSGTINDLCKYASAQDNIPYAVFATAPSMNGYFSANASIMVDGHKQTLKAHLPKAVFCDLGVIANAPKRLILSGLGDSLCRSTAQADWLLSHLLWQTPYNPLPFELLAEYESDLFAHADKLTAHDKGAVELLIKTLLVSGLGMVIADGSYPASQGEHLIAHTMEMKYGHILPDTYHGEQIGVSTLVMAKIQQQVLSGKMHLQKTPHPQKIIAEYFGKELADSISRSYQSKYALQEQYDIANERIAKDETAIKDAINAVRIPEEDLRKVLQKVGAPTIATDLGWNISSLEQATHHAKFIRNRFTFLDLQN